MGWKTRWNKPLASVLATAVLSAQVLGGVVLGTVWSPDKVAASPASGAKVELRLMSTTDVHTNVYGWDYFKNAASVTVGLDRTASLVKKARSEKSNTLLLDNGDLIQGTPLGTYVAKKSELKDPTEIHPMIAAMNAIGYDAATFGNHEFNYGLEFLDRTINGSDGHEDTTGANFDYVNANIYKKDGSNAFTPYVILNEKLKDSNGQEHTIKVGLIGLVTPQIMEWDKVNLEGKVTVEDIAATATKFVPEMKAEGADVIVAMAHAGFDINAVEGDGSENDINALSKVAGIDAITFSHTHKVFPTGKDDTLDGLFKDPVTDKPYNNEKAVIDNVNGHINGTPAVQAGYGGAYLGLIDLDIVQGDKGWTVDKESSKASALSIYKTVNKVNIPTVEPDPTVDAVVAAAHNATIAYTEQKLGVTTAPMNSYFAMVQDDPTVQLVTYAQKWYVQNYIDVNVPQYKDLPILSVGAPFKAGRNGPEEYTSIDEGNLTIRSASDLYLYDNTLKAIKVKGSVVKEWLEMSAGAFNRIKPGISTPQSLL
ncbi:bifunctional 2',3'-cyclic-nucleotide 2'-phosphodiesterase/3'-nucleotidase, partial [Paenibacillus odorifer]